MPSFRQRSDLLLQAPQLQQANGHRDPFTPSFTGGVGRKFFLRLPFFLEAQEEMAGTATCFQQCLSHEKREAQKGNFLQCTCVGRG